MQDIPPSDNNAVPGPAVGKPRSKSRTRQFSVIVGLTLVAIMTAAGVKVTLDVTKGEQMLQKHKLIKTVLPGGEWLCRREAQGEKGETFTLSVNPGTQVVTPSGPIHGAPRLDSTTHGASSNSQIYFGASELHEDKLSLKWLAHWTDPAELRPLALNTQRLFASDPARYATDLTQQNYISNMYRGITVFDKPIMQETITLREISPDKLEGTTVTSTDDQKSTPPQPIACTRGVKGTTSAAAGGGEPSPKPPEATARNPTAADPTARDPKSADATPRQSTAAITPKQSRTESTPPVMPPLAQAQPPAQRQAPAEPVSPPQRQTPAQPQPPVPSQPLAQAQPQQSQPEAQPRVPAKSNLPEPKAQVAAPSAPPTDKEKIANAAPASKLATPGNAADLRHGSSLEPDEARSFIDEWFRVSSAARSPDDVLRFYASEVRYYDRGVVSRSYIKHDKQYYFNRWPVRRSKITGPLNVADAASSDKTVSFMLWYHLEDARQQSREGTTPVKLVLGKRDGRVVIVGEGN